MLHSSSADFYPDLVVKTNNLFQVRYSITVKEIEEMGGKKRTIYDYEYAETPIFEYGNIVNAIINTRYSKDAEIAVINKAIADPISKDYAVYNEFRILAKQSAKEAIEWFEKSSGILFCKLQ